MCKNNTSFFYFMIKTFKTKFNKIISLLTATSLLISFVVGPTAASAINNEQTAKEYNQIFKEFILPYSYGKITKSHFAGTDRVIINIQDLHCHPKVQKNIANVIETFDKKYGVNNIYLEGAYGNVSTKWITDQIKKDKNLLEKMMDTGRLTGAEYYSAISGKTEIIKGLEEKEPYLDNIARLGSILDSQEKIDLILKSLDESVNEVKKQYYSKRQYKLERLFEDYKQGKITSQKYYTLLSKHIDKLGIDLTKYENSLIYLTLLSLQKDLDYKKITAELQGLVSILKQQLPYNIYKSLLENTSNFQELEKFYSYVIQLDKSYDLNISLRFPELNKYFGYIELSKKLNPVELLKEDEFLSQEINTRFSQTPAQKDVVFLVHFGRYLRDYVTTKITLEDYKYYKENIEQYRKIYNKYVDNRVLSLLDEYIAQIDKFYEINMDRNLYFTKNMFEENEQFVQIEQVKQAFDDINRIISNMDEVKRVDVVVTGGFHSQTVTELLEQQNVSYIVITPNVTDGIKLAEETYYELAKEQSKISFQTIAPVIASLSPQLQAILLNKIESEDTENIEQIMKMDEFERAQTIADLAAAKLLESDDLGNLEETLNEIVENLVDEYHKEKVTPELVSEIKNLQEVLKDKEKLQKVIDLLSEGTAKQSVMLVSDMVAVLYKQISDILVPFANKERLETDEDVLPLKDFDEDEDFGDSDIEKDGAYEDDEYYGYDVFDSLELWFSDAELIELSREIIKEGQYNENIEKFIEYLGRHNMADYELLSKILAELKSINNSEIKKEYCGVLYALTDKKIFNDKQKVAKAKEDIMSFLEKPRNIQLRFCELFPKVFAGHDETVYSFFTALLDCVNENEYTNTDFDFLVTICRYSFLVTDLETKENIYDFLTLNIEKRRLLYSFYQAPKVHTDIEINRVTLNFMLSVLHKYNLTDEQFNYIMTLICSVNITKNTFEQKYVNNLKEKELNMFVLENFKYVNSYSRYLLDLIFSDVEETKVEIFVSKLQKIVDLFDDLQEYKIDTLDTENKCFALEVFLNDGFEAYCKDNNINDLVKQYQLAIRVSRKIYPILGDKISATPIDKMDNIINKTLEYYKKVDKIISFLTLFTNKTAIFSLHNNERNPDKKSFRFTPDGIKEILKRLEIEPEVFESIEISFMDKVLDFIRKIEQDEIDKQVLLDFVNNLDGSVIVKKDILEYLAKKENSTIPKKTIIRYVTRLKISERFVEVNRYLKHIEHFNDYGQEKGVFIFDGHGASDGKSISYSETGSVTVNQIAQALINAHNNGVNLENLTLVFASCHSYKFADNIINELIKNGIDSFPQILTDAGKETIYGYTKAVDMDGKQTKVSNLFYSLLKYLDSKTQEEREQMKGRLSFKDVADAPRYLSNNTVFVTNQEINKLNNELETDILGIINEQESENTEAPVKNDVAYAGRYRLYAEMMLPSTQKALNKIGNIGIIKAVYKEKSGENFRFTTLGVALGALIETFSFWSPNFIKAHNFDPSIQAGMTAVVWVIRALSIGIGIWTGSILALFLAETITHFIWNMAVILTGRQDLLLQTSKTEEITASQQKWTMSNISKEAPYTEKYKLVYYIFEKNCRNLDIVFPEELEYIIIDNIIDAYDSSFGEILDFEDWVYNRLIINIIDFQQKQNRLMDGLNDCRPDDKEDILWIFSQCLVGPRNPQFRLNNIIAVATKMEEANKVSFSDEVYNVLNILQRYNASEAEQIFINMGLIEIPNALYKQVMDDREFKQLEDSIRENENRKMIVISEMMLPSTQRALNKIGNIGIIKAIYKEKSGENFRFTTLGVALGALIETFSFWSPNFIKAHNFDPSIQAGMTAVVWAVRALSIGIGIWTGSILALFLAETITHFIWNMAVILIGRQDLLLQTSKTEEITIPKQEAKEETGRDFSQEEIDKFEHHLQTTTLQKDIQYQYQPNPALKKNVEEIFGNLLDAMVAQGKITKEERQQYRIHYYFSPVANAYTVINSKDVFIFSELLYELAEEMHKEGKELTKDHIAAILAHELQHTTQKNRVYTDYKATKGDDKRKEYDADRESIFILEQAGYNPRAVEEIMSALIPLSRTDALSAFFDAHPNTEDRLKEISEILEDPSLVFLSMTTAQQPLNLSSLQKYGQDFQEYLNANFDKGTNSVYYLDEKSLQKILDETDFFEKMSIFDIAKYIGNNKNFIINTVLNGNYKFFTKAENDFIKSCSAEEKEFIYSLLFSTSSSFFYSNRDDDNNIIKNLENAQKTRLFDFCINVLEPTKIKNDDILFNMVATMNPTQATLQAFLDFRKNNGITISSYTEEDAYFYLTNYKYLTDREISSLLDKLIPKDDDFFSLSDDNDLNDYLLSTIFESFSQEQKNESLKIILKILTENKDLFFMCKDPVGFINTVLDSEVLTKQEKLEYLLILSKYIEKHKPLLTYQLLNLFDELNSDKTDFEKLVHLFEVLNTSENNYYLAQIFSYSELMTRYKIFEHDFDAEELKNFAFAIKNFTVKFDVFFLGYFLKLKNPNVKFYFTTKYESYFDEKYSDGVCLYPEMDVEKIDKNLLKDITLDDLIEFQNFMMDNHYYCQNISLLANFVADNILNLNAAEKVKIKKLLTLLPKGENHISIKENVSAIPYEHLKNLVDMQIFYKDMDEQTREVPKSETETSFIAFYVPFLEFRTFNPDYSAVSFEQMVENIKNHFDAYDYLRELEKEDQDKLEIYYSEGIEKMGNPDVPEERIRNMEIEKAWLVELHKIFGLSPEERKVEFNYGEETLVYTYFEINEQLFNNLNLVPTAQQAQQLVNAFSIIKKELPQEMVDVYAKLVYSLLKRNSNLSVFSSAKNNLELLDLLFEDFSVVKDDYITELLDSYDVTVEEYKEIISKTRLYFFSLNSEDNNKNVSSMEIINTILPTMSDSEKIKFFFWLLSGNDSYKPQMLKQVKISNFKYEGEINFDSLQQSFRLMTKTERENFIRRILLGKSGILEKGKASAERNGKEFEQGLKNVLFDDFFLSSLGSSKIKASSISIVFKEVFSIVFNNLSDERKVLFVNNLISALAEIKSSDEKDGDEQKARQLGRLIVALGTSSGVAVVKLLQILSNNKIFEALDDKYGSVINEEVAKVKDENEPLSKSVLFQYLEKLGLSAVIDYVGKRLGSASIGLTYLLKLKNIKDLLVAKVKRPNINKTYDEDFKIAEKLIEYFKSSRSLLDDIYKKTLPEAGTLKSLFNRELNFEEEAENLDDFSEQLKNRNSKIRVPQLIKVINGTTVYNQNLFLQTTAKGTTLDKIKGSKKQKSRIYSEVLKEFFTEIFVDPIENGQALYHADLHTGNIFVDEKGTISFIDLGGVGKVSAQQSKALKDIFMYLYAGKYNDFINALKSYNSKLYEDLKHENALNKIEEILNRKTSLESKFVDLFEIFNSLENIDSDFMMFIQAISKISGYLDKLDKKDQLTLLNNLSFDRNIQFKIIADNILTYIVSAFKKIQFNKKQQEKSQEITQEDIFREKLLSVYPDMSSEDIDLLLSLDPVVLEYIKSNTFNLTQQQLMMCGPLADKLYKGKIITEQNNKMNLLFKIASTTTFSEKNIEKLLALDENTIEKIISEITEDEKIEILFAKTEQFNIALVYKNDDFFSGNKNFERALMFAKGDKLNKSQSMMHFIDADSELIKAKILFGGLPATLTEELLRNDRKLNSLYHILKDINLSLEEDRDAIEILALLTETEIGNIEFELRTLSYSSNKNVKRFLSLYKDYRDIFSKKGESTTLAAFVTNNQNDGQIREFFDLAIKNNSIETIKSISYTDISFDISLSSEFALKLILFRSKALGIPIDKNDSNFSDIIEILKNISSTGKERILNLDEDTYTKLFSIKNNETLIVLLKHISKYSYYDRRDFEYLLNEAVLAETKDVSSIGQQQIPEEFVNLTDDYNQFEHMENLPDFAETKIEEEKRQNAVEFFNDQIESIASQSYQFAFMGNTKYLYLLQNRKNKDSLLKIVSNANINLKFRLLALLYLDKLGSKDLTPAENANIESYEKEIVKELKKQIENNEFKVLNNLDLRAYMMGIYLILRDFAHRKKVPYLIDNALIINFSDGVMAKDNGLFAEVDLFIVIHELTHRMFDKPKNGYQLVDDALDELVSYIVPNVFLRKIIKLSFDAYSQRQKRYTIHQANGVIDYINMGVKFRSLYSMFDEKADKYEIEQEVHSGPLAFLDYLFKAHQKIGKPVNWDALLDVINYLRTSRMDQLQVFREILNLYFIYTTEDNLLTKEDTENIKKEIEKMQTWTILVREILELIESVSPDTFNFLKGSNTPLDYKNEILSKTNKAKESFEEISRAYQMKYQFSKNDLTVMLILDVLKNVEYEQLENNFDGVIAGIINVINNAAENYSIDLNKQTFDRTDYLKLSAFVKSSFVVAENKGTSIKDNIIAYISKNLGQVLFVEPMINKIFGTKNLRYVFGNKKVLVTSSEEQTDRLNKILSDNNINNTTVVTMEIVKSPTTDIRDGIYLDVTKGIKAKYDEDTNTITVYSKKGIADTENIEELIMKQYFSERNEDSFDDVIAFANVNDSSMQDITERLNNAYTDSVSMPSKETNFDLSSRTIKNLKTMCNQEFASTGIKTFIITSDQAKDFAKDITSLQKQDFKFIVLCKVDDITDITNYDGLIIDASATDYEDISQLLTLMEKVKKQVLTQGVAKQVSVKFSNPTYQQFNSMNINIFDTYGIVPIVVNSYMVNSIIGKCAVEKITEETIDRLMRQNNIVGLVVDDARIFSDRKNKLRESNTKEQKYNKGYNASLSSKFDYTCNDVKLLAEYLSIDINDDNALKKLDELVEKLHNDSSELYSSLSLDSRSYLGYLAGKGRYEEMLGFIRGIAMNSARTQIIKGLNAKEVNLDMDKFAKEAGGKYQKAFLTVAVQLMMDDIDITELLETDFIDSDMTVKQYLDSVYEKVNINIEDILKQNEFKIERTKDTAKTIEDFKNYVVLLDNLKIIKETTANFDMSMKAVRGILSAA